MAARSLRLMEILVAYFFCHCVNAERFYIRTAIFAFPLNDSVQSF